MPPHRIRLVQARSSRRHRLGRGARQRPGSADAQAFTVDYVIAFRSLAYAFACFTGGVTLKAALAQRAFSTRGPNNTGVALTYMFTALLKLFFGWRAAYRHCRSPLAPSAPRA